MICHTSASTSDINKVIKSLNVKKTKGPDGISQKFVKMSVNIIECHLANIINNDTSLNKYFKHAKTGLFSKKIREQKSETISP